jgi:hypothetical protein
VKRTLAMKAATYRRAHERYLKIYDQEALLLHARKGAP